MSYCLITTVLSPSEDDGFIRGAQELSLGVHDGVRVLGQVLALVLITQFTGTTSLNSYVLTKIYSFPVVREK
jgi:hypothetical protein